MKTSVFFILPTLTSAFVFSPSTFSLRTTTARAADANDDDTEEPEGLVLEGLDQQMKKVANDLDFGQIDFLAEAKKRAAAKTASVNSGAGDDEWQELADQKKEQYGEIDDWDNSLKEAGNADSQILMFTDPPPSGEEGEEGGENDDEPKLLLF